MVLPVAFEEPEVVRTRPLGPDEPQSRWLLRSTRPEAVAARRELNRRFQTFPDPTGFFADRLRSEDDSLHQAALAELLVPLGIVGTAVTTTIATGVANELDLPEKVVSLAQDAIRATFELDDAAEIPVREDPRFDVVGNVEGSLGRAFLQLGWPDEDNAFRVIFRELPEDPDFITMELVRSIDHETRPVGLAHKDEVNAAVVFNAADQMIERLRRDPSGPGHFRISIEPDGSVYFGGKR